VIASGFNHSAVDGTDCVEAGCPRCASSTAITGVGYDSCICIHAEQRAIADAARSGKSLERTRMYTSLRPCLACLVMARHAGVSEVIFAASWLYPEHALEDVHSRVAQLFERYAQCSSVIELQSTTSLNE
jgi:dCMP deaminase